VQAVMCGAAVFAMFSLDRLLLAVIVGGATILHNQLSAIDRVGHHPTTNARQAAAFLGTLRIGPLDPWKSGLLLGGLGAIAAATDLWIAGAASILIGLYFYEWAYVRAGQLPPLS
jgi:hypothetical protein